MKTVELPCSLDQDLAWEPLLPAKEEKKILWHLQFDVAFALEEELAFQTLKLAFSHFAKEIYPLYEKSTLGVCLYRGSPDFTTHFRWTPAQEENWQKWKEGREAPQKRLFCADSFAYYFQMLSHALPDEVPAYLLFEKVEGATNAEKLQLLSPERFEHFQVATSSFSGWDGLIWDGQKIVSSPPCTRGVCLPEEKRLTSALLEKVESLITKLAPDVKGIAEAFLTEKWEGIDQLYIFPEALSSQGKRKIQGFLASGGEVIEC